MNSPAEQDPASAAGYGESPVLPRAAAANCAASGSEDMPIGDENTPHVHDETLSSMREQQDGTGEQHQEIPQHSPVPQAKAMLDVPKHEEPSRILRVVSKYIYCATALAIV